MGFFGDIGNFFGGIAKDISPITNFIPGVGQIVNEVGQVGNMLGGNHSSGQSSGGLGNIASGQNGYFNPAVSQLLRTPWGQNLQYGSPFNQDNGMGGQQQNIANDQHWRGQDFLNQGQMLPDLNNMGVLGNQKNVMNQQAQYAGVASPFGDFSGTQDPYSLTPYQQTAYNQQADLVNGSRDQSMSQLQSQLAASGITDPRALAMGQASIGANHNAHLQQSLAAMQQQAYGDRMNTLNGFNGQLQNLYGAQNQRQMGLNQLGSQFQGNSANNYSDLARRNIGMSQDRDSSLLSLYGLGMGSQPFNLNGGQQGGGMMSSQLQFPGSQNYDYGAGNPGGYGPMPDTSGGGQYPNSSYDDYNMPFNDMSQYNWNI